jgi:hypothetical protein
LDYDPELAVDIKLLYDKRKKQIDERAKLGKQDIDHLTEKDVEQSGVSKREYELI